MGAPDVTREHGARVALNIREWWPYLTDQDIQTLNTWRWWIGAGQGPEDTTQLFARRSARRSFDNGVLRGREIGR